jgi:Tol biopolymer transport system component
MRRRSFLMAVGAAAVCAGCRSATQNNLGTLTWVSEDGLWIRVLPDGPALHIASGHDLHSPRFSPSGRWVSYHSGEDKLFFVSSDGKSGASLPQETAVWLGSDDRLAIQQERDVAVFVPADGWKAPVSLLKDAGLPTFGPDGKQYIAVRVHERPPSPEGLYEATAQLYITSLAAPDQRRVLLSNEGAIQPYAWIRDGKSILYWRSDDGWSGSYWSDGVDLYMIPAAGGAERKLGAAALAHDDVLELAPKTAGNRLAVTRGTDREAWTDKRIVLIDLDSGAMHDLTPGNVAALCPAWSPDGRTIACFAAPDAGNVGGGEEAHQNLKQRKIWLLDPSGVAPPRQITDDPHYRDEEPMWSADGSHILFGRLDVGGRMSLWMMEKAGTTFVQLCTTRIYDPIETIHESWFGYYGYIDWRSAFDWRRS